MERNNVLMETPWLENDCGYYGNYEKSPPWIFCSRTIRSLWFIPRKSRIKLVALAYEEKNAYRCTKKAGPLEVQGTQYNLMSSTALIKLPRTFYVKCYYED